MEITEYMEKKLKSNPCQATHLPGNGLNADPVCFFHFSPVLSVPSVVNFL